MPVRKTNAGLFSFGSVSQVQCSHNVKLIVVVHNKAILSSLVAVNVSCETFQDGNSGQYAPFLTRMSSSLLFSFENMPQ